MGIQEARQERTMNPLKKAGLWKDSPCENVNLWVSCFSYYDFDFYKEGKKAGGGRVRCDEDGREWNARGERMITLWAYNC